jgi:hypothetical protein
VEQDYGKSSLETLEKREKELVEIQRRQQAELIRYQLLSNICFYNQYSLTAMLLILKYGPMGHSIWLNMELDLQSLCGHHVCKAVLIGRAETPQGPPPAFGLIYIRGRYWSAKIDDISL